MLLFLASCLVSAPLSPSQAQGFSLQQTPLRPIPPDVELVAITPRFTLKYPAEFTREIPAMKALAIWNHAFSSVESRFPTLIPFAQIQQRKPITIMVVRELKSDVPHERRLGECSWDVKGIWIRITPSSLKDSTPIHEAVHALLRGNDIALAPWLEEGLAHYLEGRTKEFREILKTQGVHTLPELLSAPLTLHARASGLIVVAFLIEKKHYSPQEIVLMDQWQMSGYLDSLATSNSFAAEFTRP